MTTYKGTLDNGSQPVCTLASTRGAFKSHTHGPLSSQVESEFLGVGSEHQYHLNSSSVIQICSQGWEPLTQKESSVITSANILFVFVCLSLSHTIRWEYWGQLWCPETSPVPSTALDAPSVLVRILNEWTTLFIYKWSAKRTHTKNPHI